MNMPPYITVRSTAPAWSAAASPLTAIHSIGIAIAARIEPMKT